MDRNAHETAEMKVTKNAPEPEDEHDINQYEKPAVFEYTFFYHNYVLPYYCMYVFLNDDERSNPVR